MAKFHCDICFDDGFSEWEIEEMTREFFEREEARKNKERLDAEAAQKGQAKTS